MKYLKLFTLFILLFLSNKVYALENITIYGSNASGSLSQSGSLLYRKQNGGLFTTTLNTVNADTAWSMSFYINKSSAVGKVYKVRLNFNDYDFLKSVNSTYIHVNGWSGSEPIGSCNILSFNLLNQGGSNNQAKGAEFTYNCLEPSNYKSIEIYKYDENDDRLRITTISWRLNNVQWEEVEDTQAQQIIINASQNTQNIINNQNTNTQNIIDNQNSNTQDIINNQNQNTQDMIDSQRVCSDFTISKENIIESGKYLTRTGLVANSATGFGITDYYNIGSDTVLKSTNVTQQDNVYFCFYDTNKSLVSCTANNDLVENGEVSIPTGASYVRFSINNNSNLPRFYLKSCKDGNQAVSDDINDLNDTIKDDNIGSATSDAGDFITGFDTNTFGLTSIITAPLNLIQSITSSTCTDLQIPLPYLNNKKLTLPCMTPIYQSTFGSLFTLYQTITFGIIAYWICVRIFNMVKDFKNPDHDEIEVVDL